MGKSGLKSHFPPMKFIFSEVETGVGVQSGEISHPQQDFPAIGGRKCHKNDGHLQQASLRIG